MLTPPGVLQVLALTVAIWSALTACLVLLLARIWLWRILPRVQRVGGHDPSLCAVRAVRGMCFWMGQTRKNFMLQGTIAFFHPFADGGGGGERVLWCASACSSCFAEASTLATDMHTAIIACLSTEQSLGLQGGSGGSPAGIPAAQSRPLHRGWPHSSSAR